MWNDPPLAVHVILFIKEMVKGKIYKSFVMTRPVTKHVPITKITLQYRSTCPNRKRFVMKCSVAISVNTYIFFKSAILPKIHLHEVP